MARPAPTEFDEETIPVPRSVRFPVELVPPVHPELPELAPLVDDLFAQVAACGG